MATTVTESVVVRRPLDVVVKVATDPGILLPTMAGLGRFERIDGDLWDMFIDIGAVHVGGRVRVVAGDRSLSWDAIRGTRHSVVLSVDEHGEDSLVTLSMTVQLAGAAFGRVAELLARGIARRHLVAGLQQLRHQIEFGEA